MLLNSISSEIPAREIENGDAKLKKTVLTLWALLQLTNAVWAQPPMSPAAPSQFHRANPVERPNGLWQGTRTYTIGMSLRELEAAAGPWPEPLKDWSQYASGLTVILRDDRVIHLSCVPANPGFSSAEPWQVMGVGLGTSESALRQQLGPAATLMARREAGLTCWVYPLKTSSLSLGLKDSKSSADVGFIIGSSGQVEAIMLVEKDKLKTILLTRGYSIL